MHKNIIRKQLQTSFKRSER